MADSFTPNLNLRKPEVGAAYDTWGGVAGLNHDLDLLDAVFLATGLGTSVGLHVGDGKVLKVDGTGQLDVLADGILIKDNTDPTKVLTLSVAGIATATTRELSAPDASGVIATQDFARAQRNPTGTVLDGYYGNTPPDGYVFADGRTIGNAASGATNRANADCEALFKRFWNFNDNTRFPTIGGRGASADADWLANKQITLPDHSGASTRGRDDLSGTSRNRLNSVFAAGLNIIRGAFGGQQLQQYAVTGTFSGSGSGSGSGTAFTDGLGTGHAGGATTQTGGGGGTGSRPDHYHNVQGNASVNVSVGVSVSGSVSGTSDNKSNVGPTILVDVIIAL